MEYLTLKDYFILIEDDQVLPKIEAVIPGIGQIGNLYEFGFNCLQKIITSESQVHFQKLNIIFQYLIDNRLITSERQPMPATINPQQLVSQNHIDQNKQTISAPLIQDKPIAIQKITPATALQPEKRPEQNTKLWDLNFNFDNLPKEPMRLSPCELISNPAAFIESHFATVKANNGNKTYFPYYQRLQALQQMINKPLELKK